MTGRLAAAALALAAFGGAAAAAEDASQCGSIAGNPTAAIAACTRAIEFLGLGRLDLAKAYYSRGTEYSSQGNADRALGDLNMAIELDPTLASAYHNRALVWSGKGEHDRALADYDAALKLRPRDSAAHLGRGAEWIAKGDYRRAVAEYDEAISLDPQSAAGWFGRGRARFYAGDAMMGASDLYRAHDIAPSIYSALWLYIVRKRADIPGERTLAREAGTSGAGAWPSVVVGLYLGSSTPEAVLRAAAHPDPTRSRELKCEADFYIAEWHLTRGALQSAMPLLKEAATLCPRSFIEREGAVAEVRRLQ